MDLSTHKYFDYRYYTGVDTDDQMIASKFDFYRHFDVLQNLTVAAVLYHNIDLTDWNFAVDKLVHFVTYHNHSVAVVVAADSGVVVVVAGCEIYQGLFLQ